MVAFTPDGHLLSTSDEGVLRSWPLSVAAGDEARELWSLPGAYLGAPLRVDPAGRFIALSGWWSGGARILVVPFDGSKASIFEFKRAPGTRLLGDRRASLDPSGRYLAMNVKTYGHLSEGGIRILDLSTGDERALDTHTQSDADVPVTLWLADGRLLSEGDAGLLVWDLANGTSRLLRRSENRAASCLLATPDSRVVLRLEEVSQKGDASYTSSLSAFDLVSRATREITSHGRRVAFFALDPGGTILVTGDMNGVVRVGPLTGEEPHLLFGHTGPVTSVVVSPDGRSIASGSEDGTIRLWPMPDLSKPPLHSLPHDQLLLKLRSLTNLRAVRDQSSDTGWKIEVGHFPGWATVPEWQP